MKKDTYVRPQIESIRAGQIVGSLGPASAGSSPGSQVNTNSCGFSMGYSCPSDG